EDLVHHVPGLPFHVAHRGFAALQVLLRVRFLAGAGYADVERGPFGVGQRKPQANIAHRPGVEHHARHERRRDDHAEHHRRQQTPVRGASLDDDADEGQAGTHAHSGEVRAYATIAPVESMFPRGAAACRLWPDRSVSPWVDFWARGAW